MCLSVVDPSIVAYGVKLLVYFATTERITEIKNLIYTAAILF